MVANLSLVLDKDANVRLDILENLQLSEIDKYTTKFNNSDEIREEHAVEIKEYLKENSYYLSKGPYKNGAVVVTYIDEYNRVRRLRVLYKENSNRLNPDKMIKNIKSVLVEKNNPSFTLSFIDRYTPFIFGSPYEKAIIRNNCDQIGINDKLDINVNRTFINSIICSNLRNKLKKDSENPNREMCYFHIRILDAYLHKKGIETTKSVITTSVGTVESSRNLPSKSKINRDSRYTTVKFERDGDFFVEEDGQYNLFSDNNYSKGNKSVKDLLMEDEYNDRKMFK